MAALKTSAPYVGLVASRKRAEPILEYLRGEGVGDEDLARLKIPAGLDLGARRGDEIALAILAEIVQLRRASVLRKMQAGSRAELIGLAHRLDRVGAAN